MQSDSAPEKGISPRAFRLPRFKGAIGGSLCLSAMTVRRARNQRSGKEGEEKRPLNDLLSQGPFRGKSALDVVYYCNRVEVIVGVA
jgi:hypothetical protein